MSDPRFYFPCGDCGAGRGAGCLPGCPSNDAHDRDLIEADEWDDEPHNLSGLAAGRAYLETQS